MQQDWLKRDEQHHRNNQSIKSEIMHRLNRIQRDAKNILGSSGPVPIIHDTQSIKQPTSTPVISIPEEEDNEGGGRY